MARYNVIKVGKPLSIDDLRGSAAPSGRKPNPRDEELKLLVRGSEQASEDDGRVRLHHQAREALGRGLDGGRVVERLDRVADLGDLGPRRVSERRHALRGSTPRGR